MTSLSRTLGVIAALALPLFVHSRAAAQRCEAPQVLVVLDKSSSMLAEMPSGGTRYSVARTALGELTTTFADNIDFGLAIYPAVNGRNSCEAGRVTVDIGRNSSEDVLAGLGAPPPSLGNWTPTAETLDAIASYAPLLDAGRDNHVILITDGEQWCSPYTTSQRFKPVAAVTALRDLGMTVHIVGFTNAVDALALNRAAIAAGTALPGCDPTLTDATDENQCYMRADDLDGLRAALGAIARSITDELCDGYDNDCDGEIDNGYDVDADTYTTCGTDFSTPGTTTPGLVDCNDSSAAAHPGAEELCDGIDNDCDGSVDEGCECTFGATQECGTDVGACERGTQSCDASGWGECAGGVEPAEGEMCDGLDDDCDGEVDEDATCPEGQGCSSGACIDLMAPPEDGGCGCVAAGAASSELPVAALALLGLVGFAVARRRRRR